MELTPHTLRVRKRPSLYLFLITALFLQQFCFGQYLGPLSKISIDFTTGAVLSDSEVKTAVKLAQKAGITNIARIYSYYGLPTSEVGIGVNGAETINGRKVFFASVYIETRGLVEEISRNVTNVLYSEGNFWVRAGMVQTNVLTTFETKNGTIRIELNKEVSLAQADRIVAAISAGKIRFVDGKTRDETRGVNLSKPVGMYLWKDSVHLTFSCGEGCDVSFRCTLEEEGVVFSDPLIREE